MGILDLYINPPKEEPAEQVKQIRKEHLNRLTKNKAKLAKKLCDHLGFHYEKWIHYGRKPGVKNTFHYKEVCDRCGRRRCIERTKEVFEILKEQPWHSKKKSVGNSKITP